jgi:ribosomal protein L7Ae-like RNA K-turn-binding protein
VIEQKLRGLIGLAFRARQADSGMEACRILIRSGRCGIMLIDRNTGPNTRKKSAELCEASHTPLRVLPAGMIENATGKQSMVICMKKGSFTEEILRIIPDDNTDSASGIDR